jgi:cysteine-rich repeat protein
MKLSRWLLWLLPLALACGGGGGDAPDCGDGVQDPGEECDDGNLTAGDGCNPDCTAADCGDGILDPGEQCDDGDNSDGDGCEADCTLPFCGNGVEDPGEQCDDGDNQSGDGCDADCNDERCGDGITQAGLGEQCDDGNTADGDDCNADCRLPRCGDGLVRADLGEECDDGDTTDGDGCDSNCTSTGCGNGISTTNEGLCFNFTPAPVAVGAVQRAAAFGDVDGDGDPDLAVLTDTGAKVFRNNGAGGFVAPVDIATEPNPAVLTLADLDGDDAAELVVVDSASGDVQLFLNDGTGLFAAGVTVGFSIFTAGVTGADVEGDGDLDVILPGFSTTILVNDGAAQFDPALTRTVSGLLCGDGATRLDADADLDLAICNSIGDGVISFALNDGANNFVTGPQITFGTLFTSFVADFDVDGDKDVLTALTISFSPLQQSLAMVRNNGAAGFAIEPGVAVAIGATQVVDVLNDGLPDLVSIVGSGATADLGFAFNDGGSFGSVLPLADLSGSPTGLLAEDLNGDGEEDLFLFSGTTNNAQIIFANPSPHTALAGY